MPESRNGSPEDYAEWKRSRAQSVPVRDVEDSSETPEERFRRHLQYSVPADETTDARTNRFLEKARRAGYTHQSPMLNGPPEPEADLELDENNKPVHPGLTWSNVGTEIPQRMADYVTGGREASSAEKSQNDATIQIAKNKAQMFALEQMAKYPSVYQSGPMKAVEGAMASLARAKRGENIPASPREPVQMQREFSNDDEKARYMEQVRKAMDAVKK